LRETKSKRSLQREQPAKVKEKNPDNLTKKNIFPLNVPAPLSFSDAPQESFSRGI
jgi:hypothetical protein